ncbi:MAG: heparinase II/III family protein [Saprospiraceae bacterium]|nr:heparinase II/III family protein [Saprospiraceae bacterium]
MRHFFTIYFLFSLLLVYSQPENLLSGQYNLEQLDSILIPLEDWRPFPKISDRPGWAAADQSMLKDFITEAETYLEYSWPSMPATMSLAYIRTGDRDAYQGLSFQKRRALGTLLLAEIAENKGRFLDQIVNGVWSICEESFWGVPAHLPGDVNGLANTGDPIVDLFAAETATYLSWVDYFLGDQLDSITPQIRMRMQREIQQRIFTPLMTKHHGWMGPNSNGRPPNNWNPWICSNWINTVLLMERNPDKRTEQIHKALGILDEFLNPYPNDGGCDEGPSYWGAAAASLFDNISLLNLASNDAFQYVYDNEKVKNMGQFIYRAQISKNYFLNFADADPQPKMDAAMIYRYGKAIDDLPMMQFAAFYHHEGDNAEVGNFHFFRNFFELFIQKDLEGIDKKLPLPGDVWLPDIQVMAARDKEGSTDGFYLAAKGGHNDESHNHNDIGNFVVYYNGDPLIIDVGRGTYTRKTFSRERYDIWFNRSDFHNTPTIAGLTQAPGAQYRAHRVNYDQKQNTTLFSLDISRAYPDNEMILRWARTIILRRHQNIEINDGFRLRESHEIGEHIMTCYEPYEGEPGEMIIPFQPEGKEKILFRLKYDYNQYAPHVEKIKLEEAEDRGIISKWGDRIYRLTFSSKEPVRMGEFQLTIEKIP